MSNPIDVLLGQKLQALRTARGMSETHAAQALVMSENTIAEIEVGSVRLTAVQLVEFAKLYGIRAEEFLHHLYEASDIDPESGTINVFAELDGDALEFAYLFSKIGNQRHRSAVMHMVRSLIDDPKFHQ